MGSLALLLFGVFVGMLSGVLGIGGGVVLVPGLMLLFGFAQTEAQGTSLAVLAMPIVIFAAVVYYQNGHVRLPVVAFIAVGFAIGAYCGARVAEHLPAPVLRVFFGALMLYIGFTFVLEWKMSRTAAALPAGIAAFLSVIVARLLHRRFATHIPVEPPSSVREYHI